MSRIRPIAGLAGMAVAIALWGPPPPRPAAAHLVPPVDHEPSADDIWVILVRHAEKLEGEDPDLSDAGRARAEALSHTLSAWPIDGIFVSQFLRTQATAIPLADRLGLEAEIVDAGDVGGLAERIRAEARGAVVVIGHSNTVPAVIRALGVAEVPEIPESRYDDLFLVRIDEEGAASLIHMKYGAPSPG